MIIVIKSALEQINKLQGDNALRGVPIHDKSNGREVLLAENSHATCIIHLCVAFLCCFSLLTLVVAAASHSCSNTSKCSTCSATNSDVGCCDLFFGDACGWLECPLSSSCSSASCCTCSAMNSGGGCCLFFGDACK